MKMGRTLFTDATHREAQAAQKGKPDPLSPYPVATFLGVPISEAEFDVLRERRRQVVNEGFDAAHDDAHGDGALTKAALCYGIHATVRMQLEAGNHPAQEIDAIAGAAKLPPSWPWARQWWKPGTTRACLVKAVALLIAEIERVDRAAAKASGRNQ